MRNGKIREFILVVTFVAGAGLLAPSKVSGQRPAAPSREARTAELRNLLKAVEGAGAQPAQTMRTADGYLRVLCAPAGGYFAVEGISRGQPAAI